MNIVPKDIIILPEFTREGRDRWVVMNVFARTCLGVNSEVLGFLGNIEYLSEMENQQRYGRKTFSIWEIDRFAYAEGSVTDPTNYVRNPSYWGSPLVLDVNRLMETLQKHSLLIEDEEKYRDRFQLKRNLVDREHFGHYHQQLGQHMLLVERKSPSKFWLEQKFTGDLRSVRSDNLYGAVQEYNLKRYFTKKFSPGDVVVDVGCGTGFYSNMMAKAGARVFGIDPSEEYIRIAQEHRVDNTEFRMMNIGTKGALDTMPDHYADFMFMSDALLFYFVPVLPEPKADIQKLFADIRRILKPTGTFICLEPHPVFWLMPWLGSIDRPFTVVTEYMNKHFGVTPAISKLIKAFARGGFAVTYMDELLPDPNFKTSDPRAYHFAMEFPVWYLFELKKAQG